MKKKLFALAIIASLYLIFILAFTSLDNKGKVSRFFSDVGLSNEMAMASTELKSNSNSGLGSGMKQLKQPMPKPKRPNGDGHLISR